MSNQKIMKTNNQGFTLIELLVVIAIIGLLATMSVIALSGAREKARDSRRLSDIKQMQTALEMYYSASSSYPTSISGTIEADGNVYMADVPSNPEPANDSACSDLPTDQDYIYTQTDSGGSYTIQYCIGNRSGEVDAGTHCATPAGITSGDSGSTGECD